MPNCTVFPVRHTSNALFMTTNIVLTPLLFGIGFVGNLLMIIVFSRGNLRKTNPIFVYMTGLAFVDALTLLLSIPGAIRDTEMLPPMDIYSKLMTHFTTLAYGLRNITKHSAIWIVVFLAIVQSVSLRWPKLKFRWTTISSSRNIVFAIVIFCVMVDTPAFFEIEVTEVIGHCFEGMTLWHWEYSELGQRQMFLDIYPWVVTSTSYIIPFTFLVLFTTLLVLQIKLNRLIQSKIILQTPLTDDENELQRTITILFIILVFFILELPAMICHIFLSLYGKGLRNEDQFYDFLLISNCLSLVRCSINFVIYSLLCSDFRKTFRRSFCCFWNTEDEFYEPFTCANICFKRSYDSDSEESDSCDSTTDSGSISRTRGNGKSKGKDKSSTVWV